MTDYAASLLAVAFYKAIVVGAGALFAFLGYRLFVKGVLEAGADLMGQHGGSKIVLKKAAPGIFFVLFGTAIIIAVVIKGINVDANALQSSGAPISPGRPTADVRKVALARALAWDASHNLFESVGHKPQIRSSEILEMSAFARSEPALATINFSDSLSDVDKMTLRLWADAFDKREESGLRLNPGASIHVGSDGLAR